VAFVYPDRGGNGGAENAVAHHVADIDRVAAGAQAFQTIEQRVEANDEQDQIVEAVDRRLDVRVAVLEIPVGRLFDDLAGEQAGQGVDAVAHHRLGTDLQPVADAVSEAGDGDDGNAQRPLFEVVGLLLGQSLVRAGARNSGGSISGDRPASASA
jgi:hypothetical protein